MLRALQTATAPELIALLLRFELAEPLLLALKEQELVRSRLDASQPCAHQDGSPAAWKDSPLQPAQPSQQASDEPSRMIRSRRLASSIHYA